MKQIPEFKNKQLLSLAFTHRSYLNESKEAIESKEFSNPRDEQFIRVKYLLKKGFV